MNEEEIENKKIEELKAVYSGAVQAGEIRIAEIIKNGIDLYNKEKEKNKELEEDLTIVYLNGIHEERDKWNIKIKRKIEEINNEDLEIYNTDSEDVIIAKYEQRAILDFCKELLGDDK